jgi:hypothetical protein
MRHKKKNSRLLVALPGGYDNVEFSLFGGGGGSSTVRITYCFPKNLYNIEHILGLNCPFLIRLQLIRTSFLVLLKVTGPDY